MQVKLGMATREPNSIELSLNSCYKAGILKTAMEQVDTLSMAERFLTKPSLYHIILQVYFIMKSMLLVARQIYPF